MRKLAAAALAAVVLTGCASLEFYAPDLGTDWSTDPVKTENGALTVDGVTVKRVSETYSDVVSVGSLLAPAYQGGRMERWTAEGPNFSASIELIQTDLVFSGPVTANVLNADMTDFTKARQVVRVTKGGTSSVSEAGPVSSPPAFTVAGFGVNPTYQGISGGTVSDYQSWGLTTGLRLTANGALAGYLNLTNGASLKKAPSASVDPLLTALAVVAAQPHFAGKTPPQKVVPEIVEVFGLKFTSSVSHN